MSLAARPLTRTAGVAGTLALAAIALVGCQSAATADSESDTDAAASAAPLPAVDESYITDGIRVGSGPVEVVVFGDVACPYCAALEADTSEELAARVDAGEITLVLHPMTYVSAKHGDETDYSARAAAVMFAAAATGDADAVPALYALALEHQPEDDSDAAPTDEELLAFAAEAGVEADVAGALSGDEYLDLARAASDYWLGREIPGTGETLQYVPTVAIDGALFEMRGDGTDLARTQEMLDAAAAG